MSAPQHVIDACAVHYGIRLTQIGEEGEVLVLGHHDDQRRVVAALAADHRAIYGERMASNLDPGDMVADVVDELRRLWAVVVVPCGSRYDDVGSHRDRANPDCFRCRRLAEEPDAEWFMYWDRKSTDTGAFPVTLFGAWA